MKGKKILIIGLAMSMVLSSMSFVYADKGYENSNRKKDSIVTEVKAKNQNEIKITKEVVKYKDGNIEVDMEIPVVSGLTDLEFQRQINAAIKQKALELKNDFEKEAKKSTEAYKKAGKEPIVMEFYLEFEIKNDHGVLSIVLETYTFFGGANGENINYYYNIDIEKNKTIQLSDLFKVGSSYKLVINEEIKRQIVEREKKGEVFWKEKDGFKTITDNHEFYIEDENLVIVFPQYSIGPRTIGIPEFRIPLYKLNNYLKKPVSTIEKNVYYNQKYNFQFKIAPIWEDKVYIVESYAVDNLEAKIDFVYTPKDSSLYDYKLMSILVMDRDAYYKLSNVKKYELGYKISETKEYVYIIETYGPNPYVSGSRAYNEYKELSAVINGVDDLFKLNITKEESKEYKDVKDYKWVMINGKKVNLNKEMYVNKNGTLMIPIFMVSNKLGYEVKWNPQNGTVTLDGGKTSVISIGKNIYGYHKASMTLEDEAVIIKGTTFVPISYFEKVLKLNVSVDIDGMLIIESK